MDVAIQLASNEKIIREATIRDLKECESQSLLTQAKRGEELVATLPAINWYLLITSFIILPELIYWQMRLWMSTLKIIF